MRRFRRPPRRWARFFHVHGEPYHVENSRRGILRAVREFFTAIDLDACVTSDGVMLDNHWLLLMLRDGFFDPLGLIDPHTRVDRLTWEQADRLRTKDGYRIRTMKSQLWFAKHAGLKRVELETKESRGFDNQAIWDDLAKSKPAGLRVVVKCDTEHQAFAKIMRHAKAAGFTTMALWHRGALPPLHDVDYVRGSGRKR